MPALKNEKTILVPKTASVESTLSAPNVDGLEKLFQLYSGMVFNICLRYSKNREDAEDMVSEVFIKVGKAFEDYKNDFKPMVWIYRIAVNHSLDYLRSKRYTNELALEESGDQALRTSGDQEDQSLAKITLDKILGKADEKTRQILFLSYVEGLTHEEIGKTLGMPRGGVVKKLQQFSEEIKKFN